MRTSSATMAARSNRSPPKKSARKTGRTFVAMWRRAAERIALKLRAQGVLARRRLVWLAWLVGRTNGILPYLGAPVSFKRLLGRSQDVSVGGVRLTAFGARPAQGE